MILITGGAHQGKLDFARARFGIEDADICESGVDFSKKCLAYLERWSLECVREGRDPVAAFEAAPEAWRDSVAIVADISGGVVPVDAEMRAWREANGRLCMYLAARADEVWRLFCGLPQRLK